MKKPAALVVTGCDSEMFPPLFLHLGQYPIFDLRVRPRGGYAGLLCQLIQPASGVWNVHMAVSLCDEIVQPLFPGQLNPLQVEYGQRNTPALVVLPRMQPPPWGDFRRVVPREPLPMQTPVARW